jgi:hypothetical protein
MSDRSNDHVVLRHTEGPDGVRHLEARRQPDGSVVIEGQDLGRGVESVFGSTEYEWARTIPAASLPEAIHALGGAPGDELLELLARWTDANGGLDPSVALDQAGVPMERWSRIGD